MFPHLTIIETLPKTLNKTLLNVDLLEFEKRSSPIQLDAQSSELTAKN